MTNKLSGKNGNFKPNGENLLLHTNSFSTSPWAISTATITNTGLITDPFGGTNAWTMVCTGNTNFLEYSTPGFVTVQGTVYISSVYAKADIGSTVQLTGQSPNQSEGSKVNFNVSTGTVINVTDIGSSYNRGYGIISVGNGWYRLWVAVLCRSNSQTIEIGNGAAGTETFYLYGANFTKTNTSVLYQPAT